MENNTHNQVQRDGKHTFGFWEKLAPSHLLGKFKSGLKELPQMLLRHSFPILFFVVVWALLAFLEPALLFRVNELSVFLYDDLFFSEMMSVPAGLLYYVASWLVQFFYYPVLGATIYVALLAMVYVLTYKVFDIPRRGRLLAMLPVVALLASNTQLGYWIFYMKIPGYYYVALLGVLVSLLVALVVKKSHIYLKPLLVAAWVYFAYPYFGVYAIASGVVVGVHAFCLSVGRRQGVRKVLFSSVTMVVATVAAFVTPPSYYTKYTTVPAEEVYTAGLPASQWKDEGAPTIEEKTNAVSVVAVHNGKIGYPVTKELTKLKINIENCFTQKAIRNALGEYYANGDINRPADGKSYTFTFVGKDGKEFYVNDAGGYISLVAGEKQTPIPASGHFICVADKKVKDIAVFKAQSGKYLVWKASADSINGVEYYPALASSPDDGNARCAVKKMSKGVGVKADGDAGLFGLVNLMVFDKDADFDMNIAPLFIAGIAGGRLSGLPEPLWDSVCTSALRIEEVGFSSVHFPFSIEKKPFWFNVGTYWVPFCLLAVAFMVIALLPLIPLRMPARVAGSTVLLHAVPAVVALLFVGFSYLFWYNDGNFRIENEQNRAMWNEEWTRVAELAREVENPTRQVVLNRNIALLKMGRSGNEMFTYPDGSADIVASMPVRLAQTGGKMAYYQYGKFNFCYRWCVEDAVEYGWRIEYLKHAVRSMLLSGEYRLAERYINILKRTRFYTSWACEMEQYLKNPEKLKRERAFAMPLNMTCYDDFLDVDDSYVEAYLTKNLKNSVEEMSRIYVEAALAAALTRKDAKSFWFFLNYYVNEIKPNTLPKHYQEAVLLFLNIDRGKTVQVPQAFIDKFISASTDNKMKRFMQRVAQHKGKTEAEMAPYFKDDFGGTYWYFYFFVRNIKTN